MANFPLRRILTLQPIVALLLPFGVAALIGFFWIVPQIKRDAESRQLQIARAIASQVQSYLDTSMAIVGAAASIHHDLGISGHNHQRLLDGLVNSSRSLGSLYVVKPDGRISSIALGREALKQNQDLQDLDLSHNALFRTVVSIAWIVLACILIALLCAVGASIYLARKLAGRFDDLALQARTIALATAREPGRSARSMSSTSCPAHSKPWPIRSIARSWICGKARIAPPVCTIFPNTRSVMRRVFWIMPWTRSSG